MEMMTMMTIMSLVGDDGISNRHGLDRFSFGSES